MITENTSETDKLILQAKKLLSQLERQVALQNGPTDGIWPVFFRDSVINIALPWASIDPYQHQIASRHTVPDAVLLNQLFDLLPNLSGRTIVDIGSYTGLSGMVFRRITQPAHLVMVEPQRVMTDALRRTVAANPEGCAITLITDVIDDGLMPVAFANQRPDRLSETTFIRREGADRHAVTVDMLPAENIGLLNLDIPGPKIYALKGAAQTLTRDRPVILMNLSARDTDEVRAYLEGFEYRPVRAGAHSNIYVPI